MMKIFSFTSAIMMLALLITPDLAMSQNNAGNGALLPPPMEVAQQQAPSQSNVRTGNDQVGGGTTPIVEALSEAELEQMFSDARQKLMRMTPQKSTDAAGPDESGIISDGSSGEEADRRPSQRVSNGRANDRATDRTEAEPAPRQTTTARQSGADSVPLGKVNLRIAYQNMTIENIMQKVAEEIKRQSGDWEVQWRLQEENRDLIEQRVNINAESSFNEFLSHLTAKINNLTGVRLFVKVFEVSRIIIIADTF